MAEKLSRSYCARCRRRESRIWTADRRTGACSLSTALRWVVVFFVSRTHKHSSPRHSFFLWSKNLLFLKLLTFPVYYRFWFKKIQLFICSAVRRRFYFRKPFRITVFFFVSYEQERRRTNIGRIRSGPDWAGGLPDEIWLAASLF